MLPPVLHEASDYEVTGRRQDGATLAVRPIKNTEFKKKKI